MIPVMRKLAVMVMVLSLVCPFGAWAEETAAVKELKPIEIEAALAWKNISTPVLSVNGDWFAYQLAPVKGDSTVVIRQTLTGDKEYRFPVGNSERGDIAFSGDSAWVAFSIFPTEKEKKQLEKEKKPPIRKAKLLDLETGKERDFDKVLAFAFSEENPNWLAVHKNAVPTQEKEPWKGSDLILLDLSSGKEYNLGNVSGFAFDKKGRWLAYTIDAQGKSGNGLQLRNLQTGAVLCLDSGAYTYEQLTWTEEGDGLCVLRGQEDKDYEDKLYSVLGFKNFSGTGPQRFHFDPAASRDFPAGMTVSPERAPHWTQDLETILFGIHKVEKKETKEEPAAKDKAGKTKDGGEKEAPGTEAKKEVPVEEKEIPDLVIWHWKDKRMQSHQQKEAEQDKTFSFLCGYWVRDRKFVRLADDSLREVEAMPRGTWALGYDRLKYQWQGNLDGRDFADIYIVDMKSGRRRLGLEKCRWFYQPSPDGRYLLFYKDGHFHTLEMSSGKAVNVTAGLKTSFIDADNDLNIKDPPCRPLGWTKDSRWVLLYDGWDTWKVPARSNKGTNLTGWGKQEGIRFLERFTLDPEEKGIDLASHQYFRIIEEKTKKGGIARLDPGRSPARSLYFDNASYKAVKKAKKADIYLYTRETYRDFPDFYAAGPSLAGGKKITGANPQQKDYLWSSGSRLLDYHSDKGDTLQAALFLPADYEPGKSYPAIVFIYEKLSDSLNTYSSPRVVGFNRTEYTSRGYAVLYPDIKYQLNDPGMSAVWCVLPAVKAAIATGIVDKDRIGLQGHSWGGYQTAFLVTQTDTFKAAVAGAPLTDMISMYSSIYWNVGIANQQLFESEQGRFTSGYWENMDAYIRNSPVFFATRVKTPLMILHNDADGAVDWNQGIEYFNTLRRLDKPVVMLQYKGENHGLRKLPNRIDYTCRMQEFFDHYLLSKPAPGWLTEGISHLDMEKHLKEYPVKKTEPGAGKGH